MKKNVFQKSLVTGCTNYDLLKSFPNFNRPYKARKDLADSMNLLDDFIDPILVVRTKLYSDKWELYMLDGQHRLVTAAKLKRPFDYVIVAESNDERYIGLMIAALNNKGKKWSKIDFLRFWVHFKNPNYQTLQRVRLKYDITVFTAAVLLSGLYKRSCGKDRLEKGLFKVTHYDWATNVLEEVSYINGIVHLAKETAVMGFAGFYSAEPNYNRVKFLKVLATNPDAFKCCSRLEQYQEAFENIHQKTLLTH